MPHCRFRDCKKEVVNIGDLCPTHHQMLLHRVQRHRYLSDEDSQFLLEHIDGCFIGVVATYLCRKIDTIDKFLTLEFEELTFGGPGQFLDQRKLIRVLLHQENLRQVEEEIARREAAREDQVAQELAKPQVAPVQFAPPEQPLPPVAEIVAEEAEPAKPSRYGKRAEGDLVARYIGRLLNVSELTVYRWMDEGLLPYEERPLGTNGRIMRVTNLENVIAFVRSCFGNRKFARYGERFSRFLREQTNKEAVVS